MRIAIIGNGNVATSLHAAFSKKGIEALMINSRELTSGVGEPLTEADVYIYAVRDEALREVIAAVHAPARSVHVHTSGTVPISVFGEDKPHCGILYPFQTFSKAQPIDDFTDIPLFIEAKNIDDVAAVYTLALTLSPRVIETTQADRERLHVAGVFANNFTNCMYRIAADILKGTSIPFSVLLPLIDQTAAKVHNLAPKDAQTGPAVRDDEQVIRHHIELLQSISALNSNFEEEIYRQLTDYIRTKR